MWILGLKGFNIRKIAKFKSDVYWSERRYSSAKLWKFIDICMVGGKFVPIFRGVDRFSQTCPCQNLKKSVKRSILLLRRKENGCTCLRSSSNYVTCKGVFTWHWGDFCTGASSLQFPLMALYLFTWYHHKMSCRRESPRPEFTTVVVPGREFHSGTKSRNGIM